MGLNTVLFGSPGVGKGTYTQILRDIYSLPHISTGDLFRDNIKNNTKLGIKAKKYMDKGELVPDEITTNMLKERLENDDAEDGFFLDGFPRTLPQAKELDKITKIDAVINYIADDEVIINRLSGRRICRNCGYIFHVKNVPPKKEGICDKCRGKLYQRDDDKPEAIKERLEEYRKKTKPVLDFYNKKGIVHQIDANKDINDPEAHIIEDTQEALEKLMNEEGE
ncbi:MAG: adenylate kinase [Candidatus Woesearchaeota archaeon]